MRSLASSIVYWKGGRFTPAFRDSQAEVNRLVPGFRLTQGGFNGSKVSASAGTHGGDAADYSVLGKSKAQVTAFITAQRKCGNAAFFRTTRKAKWGTRAHGFSSYHIHVVPNGYASPSRGARDQALGRGGYRAGRDGLASSGLDSGPGHTQAYRNQTWYDYKKGKPGLPVAKPGLPSTGNSQISKPVAPAKPPVNASKLPIPRTTPVGPVPTLAVNGAFESATIKRLQMTLKVVLTGKFDHYTIRALKVWLGNKDDGMAYLSTTNVSQLQSRVGAVKDGKWGAETTKALQRYLNKNKGSVDLATPAKPSKPKPVVEAIPRIYTKAPWPTLTEDGKLGASTLKRLQMTLNVALTGKLDHYTIRALKVWLGNPDDGVGVLYKTSIEQLQHRIGAGKDGVWGDATTKALQSYLNKNKKAEDPKPADDIPRVYTPKPWPILTVDGNLGTSTLKRLQMTLNVVPTGKLDHYTIRALKVWLGNVDDGKGVLTPTNYLQLQSRVGVEKDGKWGPATTKGLQTYLNKNK